MIIVPYESIHLKQISLQPMQVYLRTHLSDNLMAALEGDYSFTGLVDDEPVACVGMFPMWENRAIAWAYLADNAGKNMVAITKAIRRMLQICPFERVEATVDAGFEEGHRWVKIIGFDLEAPIMRKYRPDGGDSALYARIR